MNGAMPMPHFARYLLPVLDNLQRALAASWKQADKEPLIQGVDLVRSQMLELFGRFGITPIDAVGTTVRPPCPRGGATATPGRRVPRARWSRSSNPATSCTERVLRPARVGVAAPPTRDPASS